MWQDEEDDKKAAEEESEEEDKKDDGRYTVGDVTYLDGKVRRSGSGGRGKDGGEGGHSSWKMRRW